MNRAGEKENKKMKRSHHNQRRRESSLQQDENENGEWELQGRGSGKKGQTISYH